ncbi:MAG: nuclear transport factor 2 family protein [Nitrososphaerales archaeon]
MVETDEEIVKKLVYRSFEIGKSKDLQAIQSLHYNDKRFSKFNETPPYMRMDYNETCMYEELYFANVSDYDFKIEDLRVDMFNEMAIATFIVEHTGMLVDDYSFTGRTMSIRSRATMVLYKKDLQWLIVHEHFSKIPSEKG